MQDKKLVGYFELPEGLYLEKDCLGKEFDINFNGFKAKIFTPSLPEDFTSTKEKLNNQLLQPLREPSFSEVVEWGNTVGWPTGDSSVISFRVELFLPDLNSKEDLSKLEDLIENWILRLRSNLFGFGYNIDAPSVIVERNIQEKVKFYLFSPTKGGKRLSISPKPSNVQVYIEAPIDLIKLTELLEVTSENKSIKLEYLLLKDAQYEIASQNYRRSVLDSATAFELALTSALKKNLKINDEKLLNEVLRKNNSISARRELLKFTNLELPKADYKNKVETLRNRAIHIGKAPTEDEAKEAYKLVWKAVSILNPEKFELTSGI